MDKFKSVAKGGWHPEKSRADSGSSSTGGQGDSKLGQVKGWVGKAQGKDVHAEAAREHQSTPLSSLKDPASFAPPPKRVNYNAVPSRVQEQEVAEESRPAPGPYRRDTTGLSTAHLPKPPAFRPGAASPTTTGPAVKPKPSLPPRLPPRQNSNPHEFSAAPPPTYNEATQQETASHGVLNQGALGRLGQAGVSVSGFGIGRTASPPVPPRANPSPPVPPRVNSSSSTSAPPPPVASRHGSQMHELQNRFAKLTGPKSPVPAPAPAPPPTTTTGTSWAEKQAALRTASNLRDDPSKVSASDLKGAVSTANNFQQRHGDQVASGWKSANSLNQKYGIMGKMNSLGSPSGAPTAAAAAAAAPPPVQSPTQMQGRLSVGKKAPPPPPPPKKKELSNGSDEPPPIPLGSKPKF